VDTISNEKLRSLAAIQSPPAVSLTLPTHVAKEAGEQDAIRLKELVGHTEDQLVAQGVLREQAQKLLAHAGRLPSNAEFWNRRSDGLAIYQSPGFFRAYRLPLAIDESFTIGRRFNIKPLVPAIDRGERYLLLVLSQNHLQFFEATPHGFSRVTVKDLPKNKREALHLDSVDRGQQVHMGMRGSSSKHAAVFHGHGGEKDTAKTELEQFFRVASRALEPLLRHESAPLLLAGVEYLLPIFRQTCSYPHVVERHLKGNCNLLSNRQLHEQSWEIMRPFFDRPRRNALERLRALHGAGKASVDPAEVAIAATTGKVDVLLVDVEQQQWGMFDSTLGRAIIRDEGGDGGEDLVNFAVAETLLHGGTAFPASAHELPDRAVLGAIYRY
jgi:Bacterial archaeo-eukaryotic release factor family 7